MNTMQRHPFYTRDGGFTLIEIMVAMFLLSMILLILFSGLYSANKHWQSAQISVENNDEIRLTSRFIRKQISQAVPLFWEDKKERQLLFAGTSTMLSFATQLPAHRGGGGFYYMTMHLVNTNSKPQLGFHYVSLHPDSKPFDNTNAEEQEYVSLIDDVDAISFTYFGNEAPNQEPRWYEEWPESKLLPKLVRIKLATKRPEKIWPVIDIPFKNTHRESLPEFLIISS